MKREVEQRRRIDFSGMLLSIKKQSTFFCCIKKISMDYFNCTTVWCGKIVWRLNSATQLYFGLPQWYSPPPQDLWCPSVPLTLVVRSNDTTVEFDLAKLRILLHPDTFRKQCVPCLFDGFTLYMYGYGIAVQSCKCQLIWCNFLMGKVFQKNI